MYIFILGVQIPALSSPPVVPIDIHQPQPTAGLSLPPGVSSGPVPPITINSSLSAGGGTSGLSSLSSTLDPVEVLASIQSRLGSDAAANRPGGMMGPSGMLYHMFEIFLFHIAIHHCTCSTKERFLQNILLIFK